MKGYVVINNKVMLITFMLILFSVTAYGQERAHVAGDVHHRILSSGYFFSEWQTPEATFTFPAGWRDRNNLFYHSTSLLTSDDIILDDAGSVGEYGVWPGNSQESNNKPVSITKYVRYVPPSVLIDGVLSTQPFTDVHDPNLPSDEMIEIDYVIASEPGQGFPGVAINQKSYSFVNKDHSQYIIFDVNYRYTQQSGLNIEEFMPNNPLDAWLIIFNGFANSMHGALQNQMWDEYAGWDMQDDMATHVVFPTTNSATRNKLVLSYSYDSDSPYIGIDDTGDPFDDGGKYDLNSPQYTGFAILHADKSADDDTDDPSQPFSVGVDWMDNLWYDNQDLALETFVTGEFTPNDEIKTTMSTNWQATKKYHFEKDDDVHIIYAMGAASALDPEEAKVVGEQFLTGQITADEKNALLAGGLDELIKVIDNAAFNFSQDYLVPAAPASPSLIVTSGPNEVKIEWEDVSSIIDPISGNADVVGYRVYRSIGFRDTTYTQVYEGTELEYYVDTDVTRGLSYYYYVTAYDSDGLESSRHLNRTANPAVPFKPGTESAQDVLVVPNPFDRTGAAVNYPGEPDKILFVNLPPICTLRIYTVNGNLIKTIEHISGSADESWDTITAYNQYVTSGVYIFRIDEAKTWEGESLESSYGKFIVVR